MLLPPTPCGTTLSEQRAAFSASFAAGVGGPLNFLPGLAISLRKTEGKKSLLSEIGFRLATGVRQSSSFSGRRASFYKHEQQNGDYHHYPTEAPRR